MSVKYFQKVSFEFALVLCLWLSVAQQQSSIFVFIQGILLAFTLWPYDEICRTLVVILLCVLAGSGQLGMLGGAIHAAILHPNRAASLAAAWCMRCAAIAMPSQLTPLVDLCLQHLSSANASAEAIQGYGHGLAGLLGCVRQHCPLGLPQSKSKVCTVSMRV